VSKQEIFNSLSIIQLSTWNKATNFIYWTYNLP